MDDIIFAAGKEIFFLFHCALEVLQHYCMMVQLQKCRFLPAAVEFMGFDNFPHG